MLGTCDKGLDPSNPAEMIRTGPHIQQFTRKSLIFSVRYGQTCPQSLATRTNAPLPRRNSESYGLFIRT